MNKHTKTTLGEVSEIITGPFGSMLHQSDYVPSGIPVIMPQDIGNRVLDKSKIAYVGENDANRLSRYKVELSDIVYARRGDVEKHVFIGAEDVGALCGTGCLRVRVDTRKASPLYISFYLNRPETRRWISQHAVGSNMPNLNTQILGDVPLELPKIEEQHRIVAILDSIDAKLQVNKEICAELDSMTKTIYDYWFTQFDFPNADGKPYRSSGGAMEWNEQLKRSIPTGWRVDNLYAIAEPINGLACQKYRPKAGEQSLPVVKIKEMHEGITADTESVSVNIPEKHKIFDGDILFSWSATLEVMYWFGGKAGLNQHIFKVVPKAGYSKEYVYHQFSAYVINFVKMAEARKTTMGHITTDHLNQSRIVLPPTVVIQAFSEIVAPIHEKIGHCRKENRELTKLRDWLLPMLMNGQATVVDAEDESAKVIPFISKSDTDQRFTVWLQNQGVAARGDIDMQTMREIFDAMDDDDK